MAEPESSTGDSLHQRTHTIQSLNPSSPYYLDPEENPLTVLVDPPMDGSNYHSWSRSMERALLLKNKHEFIDGSIAAPSRGDELHNAWERCNAMVLCWITNTLSLQIAQSTIYIENARDLWNNLKERFSRGENFRILGLLRKIHSIRQGDRTVSAYFTDLKTLWEELESLRPMPSCTCVVKCSCDLVKTVTQYKDSEHVICFLKGLSDGYNTVERQILWMEPLPSINGVLSLVLEQEQQLTRSMLGRGRTNPGGGGGRLLIGRGIHQTSW